MQDELAYYKALRRHYREHPYTIEATMYADQVADIIEELEAATK
jgi:predicted SpoU family rRNA methylase